MLRQRDGTLIRTDQGSGELDAKYNDLNDPGFKPVVALCAAWSNLRLPASSCGENDPVGELMVTLFVQRRLDGTMARIALFAIDMDAFEWEIMDMDGAPKSIHGTEGMATSSPPG